MPFGKPPQKPYKYDPNDPPARPLRKRTATGPMPAVPPVAAEVEVMPPTAAPVAKVRFAGTNAADAAADSAFARPVPMLPTSEMAVVNNLVCRELTDPSGTIAPPSPAIEGLLATIHAISHGENIAPFKAIIEQVSSNQQEKSDVIRAHLNQADFEALAIHASIRDRSLRVIEQGFRRRDVTVGEALVGLRMSTEALATLRQNLDASRPLDTGSAINKIDYHQQQAQREVERKWEGTTPQGRELIRKHLWSVQRELDAANGVKPPNSMPPVEPAPDEPVESVLEPAGEVPVVTLAHQS